MPDRPPKPVPKMPLKILSWPAPTGEDARESLRAIPGVAVRRSSVLATADAEPAVRAILGSPGVAQFKKRTQGVLPFASLSPRLFPWQREGVEMLVGGSKLGLYWACGIGKTAPMLAAADVLGANKTLIVTRALGRTVFVRDAIWALPGRASVGLVLGSGVRSTATDYIRKRADKSLDRFRSAGADCGVYATAAECYARHRYAVVGWETLAAHIDELLDLDFDVAVFDESHMGKGRRADRTEAAHRLVPHVPVRWLASATPVRDRLSDLPAQWFLAAPEAVCAPGYRKFSSWRFVHYFCDAKEGRFGGLDTKGRSHVVELKERLRYYFDFRNRRTIAHLLPPVQRQIIRVSNDARTIVRHRDREAAIAHAAELKSEFLVDRVSDALIGGEKIVLVGSRRAWVGQMVAKIDAALARHPIRSRLWLRGTTGEVEVTVRQALADEFVHAPAPACLVAPMKSVSESIDLQDADRLIEAALPETPGDAIQLKGRVQRPGQKRPLTIESIVAEGTIDEEIEELFLSKLEAVEEAGAHTEDRSLLLPSDEETGEALSAWLAKAWETAEER